MLGAPDRARSLERRQAPRIPVNIGVTLHHASTFHEGRVVEVSEDGILLETAAPADVASEISFAVPLDGEVVTVRGEVRSSRGGVVGIVFSVMSMFDTAMIKAFCRKRRGAGDVQRDRPRG